MDVSTGRKLRLQENFSSNTRLSDMKEYWEDKAAVSGILRKEDPVIYEVVGRDNKGRNGLSYAFTFLNPGTVGGEYYMTKGHAHRKESAELYMTFGGKGVMLLMDKKGKCKRDKLEAGKFTYVPPGFAHRAVNTGAGQLVFLAIYHSDSGHDYNVVKKKGFGVRIKK